MCVYVETLLHRIKLVSFFFHKHPNHGNQNKRATGKRRQYEIGIASLCVLRILYKIGELFLLIVIYYGIGGSL